MHHSAWHYVAIGAGIIIFLIFVLAVAIIGSIVKDLAASRNPFE